MPLCGRPIHEVFILLPPRHYSFSSADAPRTNPSNRTWRSRTTWPGGRPGARGWPWPPAGRRYGPRRLRRTSRLAWYYCGLVSWARGCSAVRIRGDGQTLIDRDIGTNTKIGNINTSNQKSKRPTPRYRYTYSAPRRAEQPESPRKHRGRDTLVLSWSFCPLGCA